jgi:hypothetical protein
MRRLLTLVLTLFMLVGVAAIAPAREPVTQSQSQNKEQTVYVTKTGKKYHTSTCRYLAKSKISMSLKDAKSKGFTACSVCKPPQ